MIAVKLMLLLLLLIVVVVVDVRLPKKRGNPKLI